MRTRMMNLLLVIGAVLVLIVTMGNFSNYTGGYTGAPGENTCKQCHTIPTAGMSGGYMIQGLPDNVFGGLTYNLTVVAYRNNAICETAGFQMNFLNNDGTSHGQLAESDIYVALAQYGNRTYAQNAVNPRFDSDAFEDTIYFPFSWTPVDVDVATTVKTYFGVALGNGNYDSAGGQRGDSIYMGTQNINVYPLLTAQISVTEQVSCNGGSDGQLQVAYDGGLPPINVLWSTGDNGTILSNVAAGMYTATVTDAAGQQVVLQAEVTQPTALTPVLTAENPSCYNTTDGSITINGMGGTPPYVYLFNGNPTTSPITNLGPGTFQLSATDANGCMVDAEVVLEAPEAISIDLIDIVPQTSGMGGAIVIELMGGTLPYDFFWEGPNNYTGTIQNPFGLEAGTYSLTVTDGNGCTETFVAVVDFASGVRDLSQGFSMSLSPNPGNSLLNIALPEGLSDEWEARVMTAGGSLMHRQRIPATPNGSYTIEQQWQPGLYFIELSGRSSGVVLVQKWLRIAD